MIRCLFLLVFFLISVLSFGQGSLVDDAIHQAIQFHNDGQEKDYYKSIELLEGVREELGEDRIQRIIWYRYLSNAYVGVDSIVYANTLIDTALNFCAKIEGVDTMRAKLYGNKAINFYSLEEDDSLKIYAQKSISYSRFGDYQTARMYSLLQDVYIYEGNFIKAKNAGSGYLRSLEKNDKLSPLKVAFAYLKEGELYHKFNFFNAALKLFNKSIKLYSEEIYLSKTDAIDFASCYESKAFTLRKLKRYKEAEEAYNLSYQILRNHYTRDDLYMIRFTNNQAVLYNQMEQYDKAEKIIRKNLNYTRTDINKLTGLYNNLATTYIGLAKLKQAKIYIDSTEFYLKKLDKGDIKSRTFDLAILYSKYLFVKSENQLATLKDIQNTANSKIFPIMNQQLFTSPNVTSQILQQNQMKVIYENLIEACMLQEDSNKYSYINKLIDDSKSFAIKSNMILKSNNIENKEIQDLENEIRSIEEIINIDESAQSKDSLNFVIIKKQDQLDSLYEIRNNILLNKYTEQNLQSNIAKDQCILNYFWGERFTYLAVLSDKAEKSYQLNSSLDLKDTINSFLKYLSTNRKKAVAIYDQLIPNDVNLGSKKLLIIPDGIISYVPFESLKNNERFLVEDHNISYDHSLQYNQLSQSRAASTKKGIYGFAPRFTRDAKVKTRREIKLSPLFHNIVEIQQIKGLGVEIENFKEYKATREQFLDKIEDAYILHLSTHGVLDDSLNNYSFLAFANVENSVDEKSIVYLDELYHKNVDAEMVVLSACNTGIGEIKNGEGVMSLGRGFSYAGARSIITSLWEVNDESTSEIMLSFYTYLQKGKTKDEAMRLSKLDYLLSHVGEDRHPYFWAAFIPMGDMKTVQLDYKLWKYYLPMMVMLIIFLVFRKRMFAGFNQSSTSTP